MPVGSNTVPVASCNIKMANFNAFKPMQLARQAIGKAVSAAAGDYVSTARHESSRWTGQTWASYNLVASKFNTPKLPTSPISQKAANWKAKYGTSDLGTVQIIDEAFATRAGNPRGYYGFVYITPLESIFANETGTRLLSMPPAKVLQPWYALDKAAKVFHVVFSLNYNYIAQASDAFSRGKTITV